MHTDFSTTSRPISTRALRRSSLSCTYTGEAADRARTLLTMLPVRLGLRLAQIENRCGIPDSTYSDLTCTLRKRPISAATVRSVAVAFASQLNLAADVLLDGIEQPARVTDPAVLDWLFGQAFCPTLGGYDELWRHVVPLERGSRRIIVASTTIPCRFQTGAVARTLGSRLGGDARRRAREFSRRWAFVPDRENVPAVCAPLRLTTLQRLLANAAPFTGLSASAARGQFRMLADARDPDGGLALPVFHEDDRALHPWRWLWRDSHQVVLYDEATLLRQHIGGSWTLHEPHAPWQARLVAIHSHMMHTWVDSAEDRCGYDTFAALSEHSHLPQVMVR